MIFPRGARLITPAENQRFSPGEPDFCPTRKIRDFSRGAPLCPCRKILSAGNILGQMRAHTRACYLNEIIPLPRRKSRCGGNYSPPLARVLHPRAPASRSSRIRRRAPFLGGRLACRAVAPYTPQSVLAALWYFAGTPNSRRENALRCGTLRGPRIHVVKMRRHSFAPRFQ